MRNTQKLKNMKVHCQFGKKMYKMYKNVQTCTNMSKMYKMYRRVVKDTENTKMYK